MRVAVFRAGCFCPTTRRAGKGCLVFRALSDQAGDSGKVNPTVLIEGAWSRTGITRGWPNSDLARRTDIFGRRCNDAPQPVGKTLTGTWRFTLLITVGTEPVNALERDEVTG